MLNHPMVGLDHDMEVKRNITYLFQGITRGLSNLEQDTYIMSALNPSSGRQKYGITEDLEDQAFVCRWPENRFPLKVFLEADYGYLFNPKELKQVTGIVQNVLGQIEEVDRDFFRFAMVKDRFHADIAIKLRRSETPLSSHCYPEIGREKQIRHAEIILHIPKTMNADRIMLDVAHNLLHALGVFGHSNNSMDTGAAEWTPQQRVLTPRDIMTLQLLYRCPIAMTRHDLRLLWQEYQESLKEKQAHTLDILVHCMAEQPSEGGNRAMLRSAELSRREIALQEFFTKCLQVLKPA